MNKGNVPGIYATSVGPIASGACSFMEVTDLGCIIDYSQEVDKEIENIRRL